MEIIEVSDIFIFIKGAFKSLRDKDFYIENAWRIFKSGSGIFYKGSWYVLKSLLSQIGVYNDFRKGSQITGEFYPVVNKICFTDPDDPYANSLFMVNLNQKLLFIATNDQMRVVTNADLTGDNSPSLNPIDSDKIVMVKKDGEYLLLRHSASMNYLMGVKFSPNWDIIRIYVSPDPQAAAEASSMVKGDLAVMGKFIVLANFLDGMIRIRIIKLDDANFGFLILHYKFVPTSLSQGAEGALLWDDVYNRTKTHNEAELLCYGVNKQQSNLTCLRIFNDYSVFKSLKLSVNTVSTEQNHFMAPICYGFSGFFAYDETDKKLLLFQLSDDRNSANIKRQIDCATTVKLFFAQDLATPDKNDVWHCTIEEFIKLEYHAEP